MSPRNNENFLIEVPPEIYSVMRRHISEEEEGQVVLHYSPYWKKQTAKEDES